VAAPPSRTEFDRLFEQAMTRYRLPGLAVGVIDSGEVVYARSAGELRAGSGERIDGQTLFKIASNSKALITALLARLVDAGEGGEMRTALSEALLKHFTRLGERTLDVAHYATLLERALAQAGNAAPAVVDTSARVPVPAPRRAIGRHVVRSVVRRGRAMPAAGRVALPGAQVAAAARPGHAGRRALAGGRGRRQRRCRAVAGLRCRCRRHATG
jgi:hypothetical protein